MNYPAVERKVVVTGCSTGIGRATARVLRARGWRVLPTARRESDLEGLRAEGFEPLRLDVADPASVDAAAAEALRLFDGRPGALVNNAGYGQPGALEDLSREALRLQFETNVIGLQDLTNRFIPVFRRLGRGRIVHVSSVLGRLCLPFMGAYSASKFAVEALADASRVELHGSGIAVAVIEPGPIRTRFGDNAAQVGRRHLERNGAADSVFAEQYRRQMERYDRREEKETPFTLPPEAVAAKIAHALESPRPRRRYPVTAVAHFGAGMARFAPAGVLDALMLRRQRAGRK